MLLTNILVPINRFVRFACFGTAPEKTSDCQIAATNRYIFDHLEKTHLVVFYNYFSSHHLRLKDLQTISRPCNVYNLYVISSS